MRSYQFLSDLEQEVERLFLYALAWSVGGRLDMDDRAKWDAYLRTVSNEMPKGEGKVKDSSTIMIILSIASQ